MPVHACLLLSCEHSGRARALWCMVSQRLAVLAVMFDAVCGQTGWHSNKKYDASGGFLFPSRCSPTHLHPLSLLAHTPHTRAHTHTSDSSTPRLLRFLNRAALPCPWQPTTPTSAPAPWLLFIPFFHPYFVLLSDSADHPSHSATKNTATAFVLPKVV